MQRRTIRGWFEYLDNDHRELTESEFMALMLFNTREYARMAMELMREQTTSARHLEGMVGAIDQFTENVATRSGASYASSAEIREALDARRAQRQEWQRLVSAAREE